jgi:predicted metal-dependent hydrolase
MAVKKVELEGIGPVTLVKSAQNRSLRLTVTQNGVRVSMPHWTPYSAGSAFALSQAAWITAELAKQTTRPLENGQRIGKLHYLRFEQILNARPATSRVTGTEVIVGLKPGETSSDSAVQKRARTTAARALKREAELLLPPRLAAAAAAHQLSYDSVTVKSLKRRWGSCDSHRRLTFNLYLMELPWEHIDYVIKHELTHTVHMNHGPSFWELLTTMEPRARVLAKQVRRRQPLVGTDLLAD